MPIEDGRVGDINDTDGEDACEKLDGQVTDKHTSDESQSFFSFEFLLAAKYLAPLKRIT